MLKLVKYLKKYRKNVILGPIFKLTEAVFELIVPLVMAKIIDIGIAHKAAVISGRWAECLFCSVYAVLDLRLYVSMWHRLRRRASAQS